MSGRMLYIALAAFVASLTAIPYVIDQEARAERQKPIKPRTMHADGGIGAPETIEELWSMSPLVVGATIKRSRPADSVLKSPGGGEDTVFVQTAYELKINEVFRDTNSVVKGAAPIEVLQIGGDRDKGDYIDSVTDPTFLKLQVGERYVFFLRQARGTGQAGRTFVMATDTADSASLLSEDGTVERRGRNKVSHDLARYSREELLNHLRRLAEVRR